MPRAPSEKKGEAEKLFNKGMKLTDIAKKLGVPEGTVRSWKNRGKWGSRDSKKNKCNVANDDEENATLQKRKKGGQKGNKNAVGNKGNPNPKPPPDATKHGGYRAVFMDALDEDEKELVEMIPEDEELLLLEQIRLSSIRERRILKAINKYREQKGDVCIANVTRFEDKRSFENEEDKAEYEKMQRQKIDKGDKLPGNAYSIQTHTSNKDMMIARLEQELSTVQGKKTKMIEALSKLRLEKKKMDNEAVGSAEVDDWIAAVIGGGESEE